MGWFGLTGYAAAALAYGGAAAVLIAGYPGGRSALAVIAATVATVCWAVGLIIGAASLPITVGLEALLCLAWTICTLSWLGSARRSVTAALVFASVFFAALALWTASRVPSDLNQPGSRQIVYLSMLGMGLAGLLSVEQLLRNAAQPHRDRIRLLCLGLGGLFVQHVFIYSQASVLGGVLPVFWEGRGFAIAALAVLIVVALKRLKGWETELFVSRQVVFYTASMVAVGGYLLAMGAAGYLLYAFGGEWGLLFQSVFLVAAIALLVSVVFSAKIRARAKVLLVKHFFKNRYDYREEWLRLTEMLGRAGDTRKLASNALSGITGIVGSDAGELWLTTDGKRYDWAAALPAGAVSGRTYDAEHPLVRFLHATGWVVDSEEYRRDPSRYDHAFGGADDCVLPDATLIVPLDRQGFLQGFVVMRRPETLESLNFEDHDILKTAGRQVAVVLAQALAQEQLAATRQFEAMNKLSTFLMHDLKNVVAQQELIVQNARKFKHRPEFIDDAVRTMEAGAQRMRSILRRLESGGGAEHAIRTDLVKLLEDVCGQCGDRVPRPEFSSAVSALHVDVDRDRIAIAVVHAIRNAQDATPDDGRIEVRLTAEGGHAQIAVIDTGAGMTLEFIRDRLFKPFDSTKGAKGMGIGAYQIRETFRAAGGDVSVLSEPGRGTTFQMMLPAVNEERRERSVA